MESMCEGDSLAAIPHLLRQVLERPVTGVLPGRLVNKKYTRLTRTNHTRVQPNLGQGGGQAIESAYTMAASLDGLTSASSTKEIQKRLFYQYSLKRVLRASSVHGLSRMLGLLNIVYRPYLGSNPYPFYPAPVKAFWEAVRHVITVPASHLLSSHRTQADCCDVLGTKPYVPVYVSGC